MSDKVKGFNQYFVASDSLAADNRQYEGSYEWNTKTGSNVIGTRSIQDASISNAKIGTAAIGTANIGTLTFGEIAGGTATFGGTANGDGIIIVRDEGGTEVGRWDKDGIEVKTLSGTTIIDGRGLVSSVNFAYDSEFTGVLDAVGTTSTQTQLPGMTLTTPDFDRPVNALVFFTAQYDVGAVGAFQALSTYVITVNGTFQDQSFIIDLWDDGNSSQYTTSTTHLMIQLPAGVNTIDVYRNVARTSGTATVTLTTRNRTLSYMVLGN